MSATERAIDGPARRLRVRRLGRGMQRCCSHRYINSCTTSSQVRFSTDPWREQHLGIPPTRPRVYRARRRSGSLASARLATVLDKHTLLGSEEYLRSHKPTSPIEEICARDHMHLPPTCPLPLVPNWPVSDADVLDLAWRGRIKCQERSRHWVDFVCRKNIGINDRQSAEDAGAGVLGRGQGYRLRLRSVNGKVESMMHVALYLLGAWPNLNSNANASSISTAAWSKR